MGTLRKRQAAATRAGILVAASAQFQQHGFEATRVEDIAAAAGVAVPTVYKVFSNKRKLLAAVAEAAMSGDLEASVAEQAWWREQLAEPSAPRQLELIARNARQIYERAGWLLELIRGGAKGDPEVEALARKLDDERYRRSALSARALARKVALRPGTQLTQATRTLWALTSPELYLLQVSRADTTAGSYERWLASVLRHALLPD